MTAKQDETGTGSIDRVPEYLVERLAAGDLSPKRAAEVRRRLALEPDGSARLDRVSASNAEILRDHPPEVVANQVRARALWSPPTRTSAPRGWGFAIGVPVLAMVAMVMVVRTRAPVTPMSDRASETLREGETEHLKGLRPSLRVYRKAGGSVERLKEGTPAHAGDQLQVAYIAAGRKFGVVLSVDGAGQITFHLPATAGPAVRIRTGGEVALPEAYELDAAPGFERFLLVVGDAPFDTAALGAVIRGNGPAPAGTAATWFTVRKE